MSDKPGLLHALEDAIRSTGKPSRLSVEARARFAAVCINALEDAVGDYARDQKHGVPQPEPRYDAMFFEGTAWLDENG